MAENKFKNTKPAFKITLNEDFILEKFTSRSDLYEL
jgi:hypothetical protein